MFIGFRALWRPYFGDDPELVSHVREYAKAVGVGTFLAMIYGTPSTSSFLDWCHPQPKLLSLSLLLPLTKVIAKKVITWIFRLTSDIRAEEIVSTTEVFASLFVAPTMPQSLSVSRGLATDFDVLHASASLYDVVRLAGSLERSCLGNIDAQFRRGWCCGWRTWFRGPSPTVVRESGFHSLQLMTMNLTLFSSRCRLHLPVLVVE
jgi:hypothetical protein